MALLAKSKDVVNNIQAVSLKEHIDDCLVIFGFLQKAFPKAAEISGLGMHFWDLLKVAIICHDLGKAHKDFQLLLNGKPNQWKYQRHELFSIPFIDALVGYEKDILHLIKLAVAGHHKDFETLQQQLAFYETGDSFGMLPSLEDRKSFSESFKESVNIKEVLTILALYSVPVQSFQPKSIEGLIRLYNKSSITLNQKDYFTLMLLFGGLKWADHLGSAKITDVKILNDDDFGFLSRQHITLQQSGLDFYQHQLSCSQIHQNIILTAPTGSGKTESAFLWLQNQIKHNGQGRVFYILPFTASISAMYQRLDKAIGNGKTGMLHGKLSDYLNNYFDDLQYNTTAKKESIRHIKEVFKSIVTPVKIVTPFQLLKHLFGLKGYEQGFMEMAGCYLVFDEIHAYNPETFAQIKLLLEFATKYLQAKVMIMTATMPRFFLQELEQSIGTFELVKADNVLYERFKRHKVILKPGLLKDNLKEIKQQIANGKKVLVVCNTVKSSQQTYKELTKEIQNDKCVLLHGSFSGADRSKKEKKLMNEDVQLLIGTQAIEVSLDIDYDMIYTEPAPIDALIQRFGRVNRKREKGICPCYVFTENEESYFYIYNKETIQKTLSALQLIANDGGVIDEALLQNSIDEVYSAWNVDDKKKFDDQYNYFQEALQLLSPMKKNKKSEEDFYRQFDGVKILPQSNKKTYELYLTEFDFINAESQKVQIRKGRFAQWRSTDNLKSDISVFARKNKMEEQRYWITNKKYNPELGLIADEEDNWQTSEIF
ncbi:CRISPR-associated helicase Cas3' [Parafilimonas sp.]|uniref:CRISPR-associated helicase Cas3' n=1 Tax=Parafilimonas sp. TaxID=1969739 RepID=UPI0039E32DA1